MRRTPSRIDADRNYRRGAIMGLTVAEVFMLIAFALLMLLAIWRFEADAENAGLRDELAKFAELLEQRDLPAWDREAIVEIGRALRQYGSENFGPEDVRELIRRLELLEEADLRMLVDATTVWSAEQRARLLDFVALAPDEQSIADIVAILEDGATPEEIRLALALVAALEPDDGAELDQLRENIRARLGERLRRQQLLAATTRTAIGPLVEGLGGRIDETGVITLPDEILFARNSADPTQALGTFLAEACPPWFAALRELPFEVDEVRIEGHASSDWGLAHEETAYFNNLDLSQRRAGNVLRDCLRHAGGGETGRWARERATAVGHSSSRLIRNPDGTEDPERSRRVVFSASVLTDDIFEEIDDSLSR